MNINLVFAADVIPTTANEKLFINGDVEYLFGKELLAYLGEASLRCFNLEVPLTDKWVTVYYPGSHMIARPETILTMQKLSASLLTLGNNHALDQGNEGMLSTMSVLEKAGIPFTGAGTKLEQACKPYITTVDGIRIGIYNCTEYDFAAALGDSCGANPYDPLTSFDHVKDLRSQCDICVVLYPRQRCTGSALHTACQTSGAYQKGKRF